MESKLTHKLGPLPVWAWGVLLGVVLIAAVWWQSHNAASTATPTATPETVPDDVTGTGLSAAGSDSTTVGATGTTLLTNALWEAQALADLAGSGVSPLTAQVALENYLNGTALSPTQQGIVNTVLTALGAPPEGVAGTPILSAPPVTGGTTPPTVKKPTVAPHKPTVVGETTTSATATTETVKGATGYRWEYDNKTENTVGVANLLQGLKKKTTYRVRVAATNSAGVGPYSVETAFTTKA